MFERFTPSARHAVVVAQEQARLMEHDHVMPAHLLLGLALEVQEIPARLLLERGETTDVVIDKVRRHIGDSPGSPNGHIPFTPAAKKTLELSLRQALMLGHNYIGTEHLLLGLAKLDDPDIKELLAELFGDYDTIRHDVIERLSSFVPRTPRVLILRPGESENAAEIPFEAVLELMAWYQSHYEGPTPALLLDEAHPVRVFYESLRDALQHQAGND